MRETREWNKIKIKKHDDDKTLAIKKRKKEKVYWKTMRDEKSNCCLTLVYIHNLSFSDKLAQFTLHLHHSSSNNIAINWAPTYKRIRKFIAIKDARSHFPMSDEDY